MKPRLLGTYVPGSPEWHAARRWRLGGSEIAQVMGWSRFGTRDDLVAAKLAPTDRPATKAQVRGTAMEPGVLLWGTLAKGYTYDEQASVATYLHDVYDWALYNPDALTIDDLLIEYKTTADRATEHGWGRAGTDQVPLYYRAQVAWGMAVLDLPETRLLCLHGATNGRPDLDVAEYRIKRDRQLEIKLLAHGKRFIEELGAAAAQQQAA